MANWIRAAKDDLRDYPQLKKSLEALPERISALEDRKSSIKSPNFDATPVQGGYSNTESRWIECISDLDRLKRNLKEAEIRVDLIEKGLSCLTDNERTVLDFLIINEANGNLEKVCRKLQYEKSQIYRIREIALQKFTLAMFGALYS